MDNHNNDDAAANNKTVQFDDNDNDDLAVDDEDETFRRSRSERPGLQRQAQVSTWALVEDETKRLCFPDGFHYHTIPLVVSIVALALTAAGSWDCSYFRGATIAFTGRHYGLWTLQDTQGKCQLWDVLFFAYNLGAPLIAARVLSLTALLVGLGLCATMAQASQFHIASWGIGTCLFVLFVVSVSTTDIFNVWTIFWLLTYIIMVLMVRYLFVHPVPRRISKRGSKIIAGFFMLCAACCFLTLVVLTSEYCTCSGLSAERLENRDLGDPCEGRCEMTTAGYLMMVGGVFWIASAVCCLVFGVQPKKLKENPKRPKEMYAHYPTKSIVSRTKHHIETVTNKVKSLTSSGHSQGPASSSITSTTDRTRQSQNGGEDSEVVVGTDEMVDVDDIDDLNAIDEEQLNNTLPEMALNEDDQPDPSKVDRRGCCQKMCCDYRIVPRTTKEKWLFWTIRVVLGLVFVLYGFFCIVMIGSRIENTTAAEKPSTAKYFTTAQVCAFNPSDPFEAFRTFDTKEEAVLANWTVAHCGNCGECSNPQDIVVYVETRKTIAKSSKSCGPNVFLGTKDDVTDCLEEKIGFTRPCTECWSSNMINTGKRCLNTCMRTLWSGFMTDNNVPGAGAQGWLNQCLFCDEKMSGPDFVTCSGVARRRLGIVSEIVRNPEQQCRNMDVDWVDVDFDSIGFDRTQWENQKV